MELSDAIDLLKTDDLIIPGQNKWADLGCGTGTFTIALASMLKPGSIIYALDKNASVLKNIPGHFNNITIEKRQIDFDKDDPDLPVLDGILMANSLHYIEMKEDFLKKAKDILREDGNFLLIEYDTDKANPWVPHPLNFSAAKKIFDKAGFTDIIKLNERRSLFGRANLYSMLAIK